MLELLGAVLLLIVASALCSGVEAAIFSLPLTKARQMAEQGSTGRAVCAIREKPARPISVIVILNNLANIVGTYLIASLAATRLTGTWQTLFPFALTIAVILFSEILPKTIGERHSTRIAWAAAHPLNWMTWIMTPVVWSVEVVTRFLVKGSTDPLTSEKEIKALVSIGEQEGVIEDDEKRLIHRIFEMNDTVALDIMTPRMAMTWIRAIEPISVAKDKIAASQHSRVVVVGETLDEVKGIIHKNVILKLVVEGHDKDALVEDYMEPVECFHEQTPSDELLEHFKTSRVHLAVVLDDYGGLSGVVTLEDVLEVLTGELIDETDTHEDLQLLALNQGQKRLEQGGINVRFIKRPKANARRVVTAKATH